MRAVRWVVGWLQRLRNRTYSDDMSRLLEPTPYPRELESYEGTWVAVKDGQVVAAAPTSRDLVAKMKSDQIRGATVQYVAPPEDGYKVGLG